MTDNYIKILEELHHVGRNVKHDISPTLRAIFPEPATKDDYTVSTARSKFIKLLDGMVQDGYIKIESDLQYIGVRENQNQHWFTRPFDAYITDKGCDYLLNRHLTESLIKSNNSSIETNQSVISTNKSVSETNAAIRNNLSSQGRLFYITLMVAILGVASQVYSAYHDFRDSEKESQIKKLEKNIEDQQKQIKELKYKLKLLTNIKP